MKRALTLSLLASAASVTLAAPAPVSDLNRSTTTTVTRSSGSESQTQRLERLLQSSNRVQAGLQMQVDEMSLEMSELRGLIEHTQHENAQLLNRQKELFIELDKMRSLLAELKQQEGGAPTSIEEPQTGSYANNPSEDKAYKDAVDLILKERNYDGALTALEKFNRDFPNSSYSVNSHYWLGQLYYTKKQDVKAAKAFAVVVGDKKSTKRPDSLVKLGDIAARNNNSTVAKQYFQQAIDEYPDTASASKAKQALAKL